MMESGAALGLRERKKRATRAALGEAAVRLAAEHGADHVTVEMISEAAGVSRAPSSTTSPRTTTPS
ncbi:TetR family transcriptional regulator [Streptomyces sp. S399]|nr:TetR family transcriptional regulator [Streptomyces sp. S399]WPR53748.1 TetR family transcriptional regulator [Streptomyces sp. S399]